MKTTQALVNDRQAISPGKGTPVNIWQWYTCELWFIDLSRFWKLGNITLNQIFKSGITEY